ncbi:hypothetical protein DE146DRAFT_283989 [Phaeosphaeria sp. MPI-PUGE-AT-0046c]|nr:hypothetical protein DE146DRAFT_283989 [Phaeosphaeria sp. MPI-PUGE-AT-0046c]
MGSSMETTCELPEGSWDSHVHVVDEDVFPLHPKHPYRPRKADLNDLLRFESSLGITHVCLVAISPYHTDNSSIIDALIRMKGKGRAVVCIDPETISGGELRRLHRLGARAARLNLKTREQKLEEQDMQRILHRYAERIRPLGWALQIFCALEQIEQMAHILPQLGITIVIDHLGAPHASRGRGRTQPGYTAFIKLLETGVVWTKLSGLYRFPDLPDLDDYVLEILRVAPDRIVYASDWPHSGGVQANPGGDRNAVQEYRKVDDVSFIERCKAWCYASGDDVGEDLVRKIFRDNARTLWQYDPTSPCASDDSS